jgi:hypothetical protein
MKTLTVSVPIDDIEWLGIYGSGPPAVTSASEPDSQILKSIAKFVFPTDEVEVLRLDLMHAMHRYRTPVLDGKESPPHEEFFTFTMNKQTHERNISKVWCFVLRTVEVLAVSGDEAVVIPTGFVITSPHPSLPRAYELLSAWSSKRWSDRFLNFHSFVRNEWSMEFNINCLAFEVPTTVPNPVFELLITALITETKLMISSAWQPRRSAFTLSLFAILERTKLPWPHPCLASPPAEIASELMHAPTPVLAAVAPPNPQEPGTCVWLNIDTGLVLGGGPLELAVSEFQSLVVEDIESDFIAGLVKRIDLIVETLLHALPDDHQALSFQEKTKLIESTFPGSQLMKNVFHSQAFHLI